MPFWKTVDTVVIGRKTYDVGLKLGTSLIPRCEELPGLPHADEIKEET